MLLRVCRLCPSSILGLPGVFLLLAATWGTGCSKPDSFGQTSNNSPLTAAESAAASQSAPELHEDITSEEYDFASSFPTDSPRIEDPVAMIVPVAEGDALSQFWATLGQDEPAAASIQPELTKLPEAPTAAERHTVAEAPLRRVSSASEKSPRTVGAAPAPIETRPSARPQLPARLQAQGRALAQSTKPSVPSSKAAAAPARMSARLARTCLVCEGNTMPSAVLRDLDDQPRGWPEVAGIRGTVLIFWSSKQLFAQEQFERLSRDMAEWPLSQGVSVVAVNVGDDLATVREFARRYPSNTVCLRDPQGELFAQIATERLPRTYLIDAAGKVRWMDLEWTRFSRRGLAQALKQLLSAETTKVSTTR